MTARLSRRSSSSSTAVSRSSWMRTVSDREVARLCPSTNGPSGVSADRRRALVYCRVSRLDEEERALHISPEMQREMGAALAAARNCDAEFFQDMDISGKATSNRPGYQNLIQRLRESPGALVVAYD